MRNFNIGVGMDEEPIHYTEFEKAVDLIGLIVVEEDKLLEFMDALKGLETKALCNVITPEEADALDKGKKDLSKLVKKKVTDKNGKTTTKWVKAGDKSTETGKDRADAKESRQRNMMSKPAGKNVEKHAEDTRTHKLETYVKEGKDEKLKQIAKDELRKRKSEDSKKKYASAQADAKKEKIGKDAEDKMMGSVAGKTKSGKFVFHDHEGGGHEGFTEQDHKDAVDIHTKHADHYKKYSNPLTMKDNAGGKQAHHEKQTSIHAKEANKKMVAGMAEKANPKKDDVDKLTDDEVQAIFGSDEYEMEINRRLSKYGGEPEDHHEDVMEMLASNAVRNKESKKAKDNPKKDEPKGFQHHDDMAGFHKDQSKYSEGSMKKFHDKMQDYHKGGSLNATEHKRAASYHKEVVDMDKQSAKDNGEKYERTIHDDAVDHHSKLSIDALDKKNTTSSPKGKHKFLHDDVDEPKTKQTPRTELDGKDKTESVELYSKKNRSKNTWEQ